MSSNFIKAGKTPNSMRPKGARNKLLRAHRQKLREEAVVRQTAYNELTTAEKIRRLDEKLGVGVGAVKQRARLAKPPAPVVVAKPPAPVVVAKPVAPAVVTKKSKTDRRQEKLEKDLRRAAAAAGRQPFQAPGT